MGGGEGGGSILVRLFRRCYGKHMKSIFEKDRVGWGVEVECWLGVAGEKLLGGEVRQLQSMMVMVTGSGSLG